MWLIAGGCKGTDRIVRERESGTVFWSGNCVAVAAFRADRKCQRAGGCV